MPRPPVIALVGIDGAGKSTQAGHLAEWLTAHGTPARHVKNPGGRLRMDRIARFLGRPDAISLLGRAGFLTIEVLVRWALIVRALIWSRLTGRVAVMDRYTYCQYAVMRTRGHRGERFVRWLYSAFPRPDLVCFLVVSPARAKARIDRRGRDQEGLDYLTGLDAAYRSLPETPSFTVVDANLDPDTVQAELRKVVARLASAPAKST